MFDDIEEVVPKQVYKLKITKNSEDTEMIFETEEECHQYMTDVILIDESSYDFLVMFVDDFAIHSRSSTLLYR